MRRLILLLWGLCLLAGCGTVQQADVAEKVQEDSWGMTAPAGPVQTEQVSALEPMSALETASAVESSSEEPETLEERCPAGPRVLVDGNELASVILSDTTLVRREELEQVLDRALPAPSTVTTGTPETYPGTGALHFQGETWVPVRAACEEMDMDILWDQETRTFYAGTPVDRSSIPTGVAVPTLMYHAVSDNTWGIEELFVSPENMEEQLKYLTEHGYDPIFFSDLPRLADYDKPVLLTFDDGYLDNFEELFPLLQKYGVKATIFAIAGSFGNEHHFTEAQAREMVASGLVDIQSHTQDHPTLSELSREEQRWEMEESRRTLARVTGRIPYAMAYPGGARNEDTLDLMPEEYTFGVDMNGGMWYTGESWYQIDRIYVSRYTTLEEYAQMLG